MPYRVRALMAVLSPLFFLASTLDGQESSMLGFSAESAAAQRQLEARLDEQMNPDNLREWMKRITAEPFFVGAPHNKENAEFVRDLSHREWGYEAEIVEYRVLFPKPRIREVEMVAPERYRARLEEPVIPEDASSGVDGRLPSYNAYSADGDVTAELVYVNYGIPGDYEELKRRGIDVRGKRSSSHATARSWRGIKPKLAHEKGALGHDPLLRSPGTTGTSKGMSIPKAPTGWSGGVQRGSVYGHASLPGRSTNALRGRHRGRRALHGRRGAGHHEDPSSPHLLGRRAATAEGHWRPSGARRLARCTAPHLSHRARACHRAGPPRVRLEPRARVQRHRPNGGLGVPGRVDHPGEPPGRLGYGSRGSHQRPCGAPGGGPGHRGPGPERPAAQADHRLRLVGRRGAWPLGIHRMGRAPCRRAPGKGRRVHQHGRGTVAASCAWEAPTPSNG